MRIFGQPKLLEMRRCAEWTDVVVDAHGSGCAAEQEIIRLTNLRVLEKLQCMGHFLLFGVNQSKVPEENNCAHA